MAFKDTTEYGTSFHIGAALARAITVHDLNTVISFYFQDANFNEDSIDRVTSATCYNYCTLSVRLSK